MRLRSLKTPTVRVSLVLTTSLLITVTGALMLYLSKLGSQESIDYLVDSLVRKNSAYVTEMTLSYLDPARVAVQLLREKMGENATQDKESIDSVIPLMRHLLDAYPQLQNLFYGDHGGNFIMAKKMSDGSISIKHVVRREDGRAISTWEHENPRYAQEFPNLDQSHDEAYNPAKRPWFKKALSENGMIWTNVYVFFSNMQPGITCAQPVGSSEKSTGVVGADVSISEISSFFGDLKIAERGMAFITNAEGEVIAFPAKESRDVERLSVLETKGGKQTRRLVQAAEFDNPLISQASKFQNLVGGTQRFEKHETYLLAWKDFPKDSAFRWKIGVIIPEMDFMGPYYKNMQMVLAVSVVLILIAIFIGAYLAKKVANPLKWLAVEMAGIGQMKFSTDNQINSNLQELQEISQAFQRMKSGLLSFRKYVSADLVGELISMGEEAKIGAHKRLITTMFTDIAGFASLSERIPPQVLVDRLGVYLGGITDDIIEQHGTVDKYIGDCVMSFWGAPRNLDNHALLACYAALACRKTEELFNEEQEELGMPPFHTRFGIHTGSAIVGNIGSERRLSYTAMGDAINLSSRLEGLNKQYGTSILISKNTYELVDGEMAARIIDLVTVKGKRESVYVYELIGEADKINEETRQWITLFEKAIWNYFDRNFVEAKEQFEAASHIRSEDRPTWIYLERCTRYIHTPPPEGWTGMYVAEEK